MALAEEILNREINESDASQPVEFFLQFSRDATQAGGREAHEQSPIRGEQYGFHGLLTLGLPAALESDRVAAKTEPYPGRWTTHFVISDPSDLDKELFDWIEQAYQFAQAK